MTWKNLAICIVEADKELGTIMGYSTPHEQLYPAGPWRKDTVIITSKRSRNVVLT